MFPDNLIAACRKIEQIVEDSRQLCVCCSKNQCWSRLAADIGCDRGPELRLKENLWTFYFDLVPLGQWAYTYTQSLGGINFYPIKNHSQIKMIIFTKYNLFHMRIEFDSAFSTDLDKWQSSYFVEINSWWRWWYWRFCDLSNIHIQQSKEL